MPSHVKTYQRKTRLQSDKSTKSVEAINALFAVNLTKRLKSRRKGKVKLKELPPRTVEYHTDESLHVEPNNTFDKLLKGKVFNKIKVCTNVQIEASECSTSVSFHSPIMTRSRNRTKVSTLDLPVTKSLSVEAPDHKPKNVSSLSYIQIPKIAESHHNETPFFSDTFREHQCVHASTPFVGAVCEKLITNPISPITKSDSSNSSKLIEKSYDQIRGWDESFPKLEVVTEKNDWKLDCEPLVYLHKLKQEGGFCGWKEEEQNLTNSEAESVIQSLRGLLSDYEEEKSLHMSKWMDSKKVTHEVSKSPRTSHHNLMSPVTNPIVLLTPQKSDKGVTSSRISRQSPVILTVSPSTDKNYRKAEKRNVTSTTPRVTKRPSQRISTKMRQSRKVTAMTPRVISPDGKVTKLSPRATMRRSEKSPPGSGKMTPNSWKVTHDSRKMFPNSGKVTKRPVQAIKRISSKMRRSERATALLSPGVISPRVTLSKRSVQVTKRVTATMRQSYRATSRSEKANILSDSDDSWKVTPNTKKMIMMSPGVMSPTGKVTKRPPPTTKRISVMKRRSRKVTTMTPRVFSQDDKVTIQISEAGQEDESFEDGGDSRPARTRASAKATPASEEVTGTIRQVRARTVTRRAKGRTTGKVTHKSGEAAPLTRTTRKRLSNRKLTPTSGEMTRKTRQIPERSRTRGKVTRGLDDVTDESEEVTSDSGKVTRRVKASDGSSKRGKKRRSLQSRKIITRSRRRACVVDVTDAILSEKEMSYNSPTCSPKKRETKKSSRETQIRQRCDRDKDSLTVSLTEFEKFVTGYYSNEAETSERNNVMSHSDIINISDDVSRMRDSPVMLKKSPEKALLPTQSQNAVPEPVMPTQSNRLSSRLVRPTQACETDHSFSASTPISTGIVANFTDSVLPLRIGKNRQNFAVTTPKSARIVANLTESVLAASVEQNHQNQTPTTSKIVILSDITLGPSLRLVQHDHSYSSPHNQHFSIGNDFHLSDIIESTYQEGRDYTSPKCFRKPKPKSINLKAGKSYRRSLSLLKRNSIVVCAKDCFCLKCRVKETNLGDTSRRRTMFVSVGTTGGRRSLDGSMLEEYARHVQQEDRLIHDSRLQVTVTARDLVLRRCCQTDVLPFEECYPTSVLQNCQKIGEGVYGEVFLYQNQDGGNSVMKIIPIEGDLIVNGERQKKFEEILSEVVISMELSNLRNSQKNSTSCFSEVQKVRCTRGNYPDKLLDLWELYDETKGSENESPQMFPSNQMYIVLELANGGKDLEGYVFDNAKQAFAVFKQTACALAVAETELKFEHRDLHWGNVLVSSVDKRKSLFYRLEGKDIEVETNGVEATVIDFTLSRMEFEGVVIFNDLSRDEELFISKGDYQFEIYRLMQRSNRNDWQHFEPYTNVLWLHYLLDKTTQLRYKHVRTKVHKEYLMKLKKIKEEVLSFNSVADFVKMNFI